MSSRPDSNFIIINLASQSEAVARHVEGWPKGQIIDWLSRQGELNRLTDIYDGEYFEFRSGVGFRAIFYLKDDEFLFIGDHTTRRPKR
jgi:hypothetical protein